MTRVGWRPRGRQVWDRLGQLQGATLLQQTGPAHSSKVAERLWKARLVGAVVLKPSGAAVVWEKLTNTPAFSPRKSSAQTCLPTCM